MRIGIDGSATLKEPTGIGRYVRRLVESMARAAPEDEFVVLTVSHKDAPAKDLFGDSPNVSVVHKKWPGRCVLTLWEHFRWPTVENMVGEVDVFHTPNNFVLPQRRGKRITTIHDLFFLKHPKETHQTGGQYHYRVLSKIIHEADHVIAVSQATAYDIVELLGVAEAKISVIHQGVEKPFFAARQLPTANCQLPTDRPYVLYLGTIEPRKDVGTLIDAMQMLWENRRFEGALVLAGLRGWASEELLERCGKLSTQWPLRLTGYVPEQDVFSLLAGARLVVVPSRYEGFGLTGLEAMAAGVPVISTRRGALPEVYGEAAAYFECGDAQELANRISELWRDEALRAEMSRRGRARAACFTWDETARRTLEVYRKVCLGAE
ncbi:MAG: glycosyltransferase family 4 protein [Candidatus Coatesbacteria bacterium]|nr:glycosyltransferase family 4 protein [Candidatus Coatesbacteria bacterium]